VTGLALGAQWVLGTLGIWSVFVGNLLAVAAMGWYVWQTHRFSNTAARAAATGKGLEDARGWHVGARHLLPLLHAALRHGEQGNPASHILVHRTRSTLGWIAYTISSAIRAARLSQNAPSSRYDQR